MTAILSDLNAIAKEMEIDAGSMINHAKNMKDISSHSIAGADELRQFNHFATAMRAALDRMDGRLTEMESVLDCENDWMEALEEEAAEIAAHPACELCFGGYWEARNDRYVAIQHSPGCKDEGIIR